MYVVRSDDKFWGPFKSAEAAAKWAHKNLVETCDWIIQPLKDAK